MDEMSSYLSGQLNTSGWPWTLVIRKVFQLLPSSSKKEIVIETDTFL